MRIARHIGLLVAALAMALLPDVGFGQRTRFPTPAPLVDTAATPQPVPVTPGTVPGPLPFESSVQPPPPTWDPYAPPGAAQAPSLLGPDYAPPVVVPGMGEITTKMQRFLDELRLDYVFIAARGSKRFGTNDLELSSSFAIPAFGNTQTPFYVTPGFAFHWWKGPVSTSGPPPVGILADLPPRVYDAWLDAAWNPQITPQLGGELAFRIGVYSDFSEVTAESLRYTGKGYVVVGITPNLKAKGGIVYLDRVRIKVLPAGGLVWTPNPDVQLDILFPDPRIARRLTTIGNTEWWIYARGEYGGGSWTVKPDAGDGPLDQIDYNDLRFALGLDFERGGGLGGLIELGTAFDRELLLRSTRQKYSPSTTIFLRAGLTY